MGAITRSFGTVFDLYKPQLRFKRVLGSDASTVYLPVMMQVFSVADSGPDFRIRCQYSISSRYDAGLFSGRFWP
jgi:hypothetical protein